MRWIKRNKEILLQIFIFIAIAILQHKIWMFYVAAILTIMLLFKKVSILYIFYLKNLINYIGFVLKKVLFFVLFVVIIFPISLIIKFGKGKNSDNYNCINRLSEKTMFNKMW
jgi:hypothetical protein